MFNLFFPFAREETEETRRRFSSLFFWIQQQFKRIELVGIAWKRLFVGAACET